jgi:hypothetical protein
MQCPRAAVAPVKPVPVTVTSVPPPVPPEVVPRPVTVGAAGAVNVNWSAETAADVPPGAVTMMSSVAGGFGGVVTIRLVSDATRKLAAGTLPNETALAPVKPVPVTVIIVPPPVVPDELLALLATYRLISQKKRNCSWNIEHTR